MSAPPDQAARDAVARELGQTLFVEAGAGTGKTSALVDRIVELVASGVHLASVAAITFTEAAASELRDRVRTALEKAAVTGRVPSAAVAEVDDAAILTLHAFAQRILAEHPLEAGLPPAFEVLDEIASSLDFDERWARFLDGLYRDPEAEPLLLWTFATGLRLPAVRAMAETFQDQRDRLEATPAPLPPLEAPPVGELVAALRAAAAEAHRCIDPTDKLAVHLAGLTAAADRYEAAAADPLELLHLLSTDPGRFRNRFGKAASWRDGCEDVRDLTDEAQARFEEALAAVRGTVVAHMVERVRALTLASAAERTRQGRLVFHDLLVLARDVLRRDDGVRRALHDRYRHLLIDEFQDTDPIQVELAVLLATSAPSVGDRPWSELPIDPGRLFFVGDPKQSIYRFRRADIDLFLQVRDRSSDDVLQLASNFRSVPGIIDWVNRVFGHLMGAGTPGAQAAYVDLLPQRRPVAEPAAVSVFGHEHDRSVKVDEVRSIEAGELAGLLREVVDAWPVRHGDGTRPASWKDITILLPTRATLPFLEQALDAAEVPYRVDSSTLVWGTQQIRELLAVLRAIDDPADQVAVVTALRAPCFGCTDDDLLRFRTAGGRWDARQMPETLDDAHPVVHALRTIHDLHDQRWWAGVSGIVERVARELRFFELAFAHRRPRDHWRRLRFVIEQARAFEETSGSSLRRFVAWADRQSAGGARVREPSLPESDDEAVRIMTIHGAKGLQFPIVVMTGLNRPAEQRPAAVLWDEAGHLQVRIGRFSSGGYDSVKEREKALDRHEADRLLYVAATRAEDHLVLSLHRTNRRSDATVLAAAIAESEAMQAELAPSAFTLQAPPPARPRPEAPDQPLERQRWDAARQEVLAASRRPLSRSATAIAHAVDEKGEVDVEVNPHRRGRAGSAIGRAVHAALQFADLRTGAGLEPLAESHAAAEGVTEHQADVLARVRAAVAHPVVQEAVARRHWRELYVGAPVGGAVVEGFVDLLYERDDGLVIVDYKTDRARGDAERATLAVRYGPQLATYALALEASTGRRVVGAVLLFLGAGTAEEEWIEDLPGAMADVRQRLTADPVRGEEGDPG